MTTTKKIPIGPIRTDGNTQPRAAIDGTACEEYAEAMKAGDQFPPVEVYDDGQHCWLVVA